MYALGRWLVPTLVLGFVAPAVAADKAPAVGRLVTDTGSLMMRDKPGGPWLQVKQGAEIPAEELLVALPGARVETSNKAAELYLMSDIDHLSPLPIVESAVVLHASKDFDLDFTLDRGRVDVIHTRDKGDVKVKVRFQKRAWELTLTEPGTRVALEIYGRWLPGSKFTTKPGEKDVPLVHVIMLVIKGKVDRKCPLCQNAMSAPPGPALYEWDSMHTQDRTAHTLAKLPAWATHDPATTERGKISKARLDKFRDEAARTSVSDALKKFVRSDKPEERKLAVYAMGSLDELALLGQTFAEGAPQDTWDHAVVALRHWVGRAPGQEQLLYQGLTKTRGFSDRQAEWALQLLFGFDEEEEARPELYEILIDSLKEDALAVRGLAYWHLRRLAPAVKVKYDAAGSKDDWARAIKEYRTQIPKGKLPPKPDLNKDKNP